MRANEFPVSVSHAVLSRAASAAVLALAVALMLGCPPPPKGEDMPKRAPAKPVPVGGAVVAEFPADGTWHPSGFLLRPRDLVRFELQGEAACLSNDAVWVTVGVSVSFCAVSQQPVRVSRIGEVMLRADPERLAGFEPKTIQVKILNLAPAGPPPLPDTPRSK